MFNEVFYCVALIIILYISHMVLWVFISPIKMKGEGSWLINSSSTFTPSEQDDGISIVHNVMVLWIDID